MNQYVKNYLSEYNYRECQVSARRLARNVLKTLNITTPPIDLSKILNHYDIIEMNTNLCGCDGYTLFLQEKNKYLICYDLFEKGYNRSRFTIAHELGHVILKHFILSNTLNSKCLENYFDYDANSFANELLLPKFLLKKYNGTLTIYELATLFNVNKSVILTRIKTIKKRNKKVFVGVCSQCGKVTFYNTTNYCINCKCIPFK